MVVAKRILNLVKGRRLRTYSLILFFSTFLFKILAFLKEIIVANYYGTSVFKDGFVALITLLSMVYSPMIQSLIVVVPKFINEKYRQQFSFILMMFFFCIQVFFSIALYLFGPNLIELIYQGMNRSRFKLRRII